MKQHADVAIVGAGIVGLAHAWLAAREGEKVVVFERDPRAGGASIRNFGMIWPVGQPAGETHALALASRSLWCELAEAAGFWLRECGSIHLAHREDERTVLQEFAGQASSLGYDCRLLTTTEVLDQSGGANPDGVLGGLWSPTEMCVDPREVIRVVPEYLREQHDVELHFATPVREISAPELTTADGVKWQADRIIVASGSDFETLFPDIFASSGLRRCKLQMLRTPPQPSEWRLGPHLGERADASALRKLCVVPLARATQTTSCR
jgi:FAD dependent oxidoreductase TIGR03364